MTQNQYQHYWERLPALPSPNGGFAVWSTETGIMMAGGSNWENGEKKIFSAIYQYDVSSKQWYNIGKLPYPCAYPLVATSRGNNTKNPHTRIIGGLNNDSTLSRILEISADKQVREASWTLPSPLAFCAGTFLGEKLILAGGTSNSSDLTKATNEATLIDTISGKVSKLKSIPGEPFFLAASARTSSGFYIFGGATFANGQVENLSRAFFYDESSNNWQPISPYPIRVRGIAAVTLDDDRIFLAGGYASEPDGFCDKAYIYHVSEDRYEATVPIPYSGGVHLVTHDGYLYCIGGEDALYHRSDGFYRIPFSIL